MGKFRLIFDRQLTINIKIVAIFYQCELCISIVNKRAKNVFMRSKSYAEIKTKHKFQHLLLK